MVRRRARCTRWAQQTRRSQSESSRESSHASKRAGTCRTRRALAGRVDGAEAGAKAAPETTTGHPAIVTDRGDSSRRLVGDAKVLSDFGAGGGTRTPDLARMKRPL